MAFHKVYKNFQSLTTTNVKQVYRTGYHFQPKQNWINGTSFFISSFFISFHAQNYVAYCVAQYRCMLVCYHEISSYICDMYACRYDGIMILYYIDRTKSVLKTYTIGYQVVVMKSFLWWFIYLVDYQNCTWVWLSMQAYNQQFLVNMQAYNQEFFIIVYRPLIIFEK